MDIEQKIIAALGGLFDGRFTPHVADQEPETKTYPYAVYAREHREREENWCDGGGYERYRYEIDIYARDYSAARDRCNQAVSALRAMAEWVDDQDHDAGWEIESKSHHMIIRVELRDKLF